MATSDSTSPALGVPSNKALPYEDVERVCQQIAMLAGAIEQSCLDAVFIPPEGVSYDQVLLLAANAAATVGLMADHLVGYDMKGPGGWHNLPEIESKGVSRDCA